MTRTIMTVSELDALPVGSVVRGAAFEYGPAATIYVRQEEFWYAGWGADEEAYFDLPVVVLHDPSAPVVPVVSDAAVSRGLAQSAAGETVDLGDFTQYLIPDAAVEAAARAIHAEGWTCEAHEPEGLDECEQCATSTPRLARAVLSAALPFLGAAPSATREDLTGVINDAAFEGVEYDRAERVAAYLHARFTITPRTDR